MLAKHRRRNCFFPKSTIYSAHPPSQHPPWDTPQYKQTHYSDNIYEKKHYNNMIYLLIITKICFF